MKCTEKHVWWIRPFTSAEHDWRIVRVHKTYMSSKPSCLEEICRLCQKTQIRYSGHSIEFWEKLKSEQPEK